MNLALSVLFTSVSITSAFVPSLNYGASRTHLCISEDNTELNESVGPIASDVPDSLEQVSEVASVFEEPMSTMSESMPFMDRPIMLDGSMAGDVGFDPLGFAKTSSDLINYREAEIKHARLAMLAAAGWPLSELFDKKIANMFGLTPVVDASDRAPSILNGGLEKISPFYWVACVAAAAAVDVYGISRSKSNDPSYFPGNLGFDPLGLYPKNEEGQKRMQTTEIKNGRLAMIAVTAFAVQEFVSQTGVVDETPLFFKPISYVMKEYANSGYYLP